jgi:nickel/cobalt exporter
LHLADADGDGVTTQAERDAYVARLAPDFAKDLKVLVDGFPVPLHALRWMSSLPTEQGGFSLRLDVDFSGALPAMADHAPHTLTLTNENYPRQIGWNEITVQAPPSLAVYDTDAFSTSVTAALAAAVQSLPASSRGRRPSAPAYCKRARAHRRAPPPGAHQARALPRTSGCSARLALSWI